MTEKNTNGYSSVFLKEGGILVPINKAKFKLDSLIKSLSSALH